MDAASSIQEILMSPSSQHVIQGCLELHEQRYSAMATAYPKSSRQFIHPHSSLRCATSARTLQLTHVNASAVFEPQRLNRRGKLDPGPQQGIGCPCPLFASLSTKRGQDQTPGLTLGSYAFLGPMPQPTPVGGVPISPPPPFSWPEQYPHE